MFTQCPECATVFPVSADALSISAGNVRCGTCGEVFFAVQSLSDSLDEDGQIPTCFHSDHPPTLNDPKSDAPPMDDLFWPTAPSAGQSQNTSEPALPVKPPPALDMRDDEALEREFDRLLNEPDSTATEAQTSAPQDVSDSPTEEPGQLDPDPGSDGRQVPSDEAWIAHRYGLATSDGQPEQDQALSDSSADGGEPQAAALADVLAPPEQTATAAADTDPLAQRQGPLGAIDAAVEVDAPEAPEPDEPLPEVFTRRQTQNERADEDGAPAEAQEEEALPSGIAFELAADRAARTRTRGTWLWGLWSSFALVALLGQWFALEHDQLARNEALRPWVSRACRVFNCRIELPIDLASIQLTSRSIEPHPSVEGALLISATLQNQASFPQPHPVVEITMADLSGRAVAMRRFTPAQYLESPNPEGMIPGHLLPLVFEVIDPGRNAVAFEFTFR